MMKSISNWMYLKQQIYIVQIKEHTYVTRHLNMSNKILWKLINIDVKLKDETNALLFWPLLFFLFKHLFTIILYNKNTIQLEEVTSFLLSNEMRKRPGSKTSQLKTLFMRSKHMHWFLNWTIHIICVIKRIGFIFRIHMKVRMYLWKMTWHVRQ